MNLIPIESEIVKGPHLSAAMQRIPANVLARFDWRMIFCGITWVNDEQDEQEQTRKFQVNVVWIVNHCPTSEVNGIEVL